MGKCAAYDHQTASKLDSHALHLEGLRVAQNHAAAALLRLVDTDWFMTPLMVAFISYTFFALEALSDEIEEPFGTMPNDLPLEAMALTIEATLRESIGDTEPAPKPSEPVDFVQL